ncbi:MAG: hypothetical protein MUC96_03725 [Myxococcaceae bacterium]|jgi:hypothetical protein|nr:hypothetical protein [Myxococcaceae bacterium]
MLERDPELERLLAPERIEPPAVEAALRDRVWRRVRETVERPARRQASSPAWLVAVLAVGVAVGLGLRPQTRPAQAIEAPAPSVAPPLVADVERDAGSRLPAPPPASAFDSQASRGEIRKALEADSLLRATALLDEHQRRAPGDDVSEEREALLVRSAASSRASDVSERAASFRARYPSSGLLAGLEPVAPSTQPPDQTFDASGCTVTGGVTFEGPDANRSHESVIVTAWPETMKPSFVEGLQVIPADSSGFPHSGIVVVPSKRIQFGDAGVSSHLFVVESGVARLLRGEESRGQLAVATPGPVVIRCDAHPGERAVLIGVPGVAAVRHVDPDGGFVLPTRQTGPFVLSAVDLAGNMTSETVDGCDAGFVQLRVPELNRRPRE